MGDVLNVLNVPGDEYVLVSRELDAMLLDYSTSEDPILPVIYKDVKELCFSNPGRDILYETWKRESSTQNFLF